MSLESLIEDTLKTVLDGGDISTVDDDLISDYNYFVRFFSKDYNGGSPITDYIVNNNFFKRVNDYQGRQENLVAARTGLSYSENLSSNTVTLSEIWREWLSITEFESVKGDLDLLARLKADNEFDASLESFPESYRPYLKILHTILDIAIFKYTVYCKLFSKSLIITDVDHFFLSMHALLCMYIPYFLVIHLLVDIWVDRCE